MLRSNLRGPAFAGRNADFAQDLSWLERGGQHFYEEIRGLDDSVALGAGDDNFRIEREDGRRPVSRGIRMRDASADCPLVAHLYVAQLGCRFCEQRAGAANNVRGRHMNLLQTLEAEQIAKFNETKKIPEFRPGDTLKVGVKVVEGERTRVQNYEGVCIARSNKGMGSNFTVRKISFGEGVERVFPLYSPNVESIEVVRKGAVRRAKLYYLRGRTGKSARIAERRDTRPAKGTVVAE